jgi:hypothetical protein
MGLLSAVGNFFFGKSADIFDENGHVLHKFPQEKWQKWNARLGANPEYDWRHHSAEARLESKATAMQSAASTPTMATATATATTPSLKKP